MFARCICIAALIAATGAAEVRVWQGTLKLPTYEEGAPDPNPPFDVFASTRFNYPYTLRENLTSKRIDRDWRALYLENEYLKCAVLPDVGGHLYSCTDKINNREMFYANPTLKKARVGYRGAWSAFGIEFNYPVSHNWMSMSPVDFATATHPDGSASVWVGNTDRPYGTRWTVELILRPGSAVLEQHMRLTNPSPVRHRFYWWNNAAVEVWDDSHIFYPMRWTASHGFTRVDTWPVNSAGLDLSIISNHKAGPVSQFAYGSREPFMGVYHPKTNAGTVHYARYAEVPHKKIWTWGVTPDGLAWREALSDNKSAYAEIQGGLFRNQETFAFIDPQDELEFSEYWMPVREIGGISRANLHGVVYMERKNGQLSIGLNVNHVIDGAKLRMRVGDEPVHSETLRLSPEKPWRTTLPASVTGKVTFEVTDDAGKVLLAHTEGVYDWAAESDIKTGPQRERDASSPTARSEGDWVELGMDQELNGKKLVALETYRKGLEAFPQSFLLQRAAGRVATDLMQFEPAVKWLRGAQTHVSNDPDVHYYLGLGFMALGRERDAKTEFEGAYRLADLRDAARVQLGGIAARDGRWDDALRFLTGTVYEIPVLRQLGRDRREVLATWKQRDPADSLVRLESGEEAPLWRHLAADPDRVIRLADQYMHVAMWKDALTLLDRRYPDIPAAEREPGSVLPQEYPLVAYYRGYVRQKLGSSGTEDFALASKQKLNYVFPNRAATFPVLRAAIAANPKDASAHALLGSLYMSGGMTDDALREWEAARSLNKSIPSLHRNLARTLSEVKRDYPRAAEIYREGVAVDPQNVEVYSGLAQTLALLGRPATERVAALERYPDRAAMPAPLVFELALSEAEAGRFGEAESLFEGRFFPREEGGTDVRQVRLEVALQKALATKDTQGLARLTDFSKGFESGARFNYLAGVAAERAGQRGAAEEHWRRAASHWNGPDVAYANAAAKRLPGYNAAEWRGRLETRLQALSRDVEANPGTLEVWRGTILRALGRNDEAQQAFTRAILLPDRYLSRYLARSERQRTDL